MNRVETHFQVSLPLVLIINIQLIVFLLASVSSRISEASPIDDATTTTNNDKIFDKREFSTCKK